jgi:hypothetical protein
MAGLKIIVQGSYCSCSQDISDPQFVQSQYVGAVIHQMRGHTVFSPMSGNKGQFHSFVTAYSDRNYSKFGLLKDLAAIFQGIWAVYAGASDDGCFNQVNSSSQIAY